MNHEAPIIEERRTFKENEKGKAGTKKTGNQIKMEVPLWTSAKDQKNNNGKQNVDKRTW